MSALCRHGFPRGECPINTTPECRNLRPRTVRASAAHIPITEDDPARTWTPADRATDDQMTAVLEILIDKPTMSQRDIANELARRLELSEGTARGATCASLLYLRQAGWVKADGDKDEGSTVWRLVP